MGVFAGRLSFSSCAAAPWLFPRAELLCTESRKSRTSEWTAPSAVRRLRLHARLSDYLLVVRLCLISLVVLLSDWNKHEPRGFVLDKLHTMRRSPNRIGGNLL